jgi:hypothetical protein
MGCNNSRKFELLTQKAVFSLKDSIERSDCNSISESLTLYSSLKNCTLSSTIDAEIIEIREFTLSPLSYAVWTGQARAFLYLIQYQKASFQAMQNSYQCKHLLPIHIICERGYFELIKEYLPYYLEYLEFANDSMKSNAIDTNEHKGCLYSFTYNAVQIACDMEHIGIICYIFDYFKGKVPPDELNFYKIDETTGNNCALIACRTGSLALLKVLYEKIKADFHIRNKKKQTALHVLAESIALNPNKHYLPAVVYLLDVVKVDISYRFTQIMDLIQDKDILGLLEERYRITFSLNKGDADSFLFGKEENSKISGISSICKPEEEHVLSSNELSYRNLLVHK